MNSNSGFNLGKKPKSVKCYICGHDFGTSSIEIHIRQCKTRVENEKGKKIILPPEYEDIFIRFKNKENITSEELDEFNEFANELYKEETLVQCQNCGRRFLKESLEKHKKMCKVVDKESLNKFSKGEKINGNKKNSDVGNSTDIFLQKLNNELNKENESKNKTIINRDKSQNREEKKEKNFNSPSPSKLDSKFSKPKTLTCYICGRDFGLTSLEIHMKTCEKSFYNEETNKKKKLLKVFQIF